MSDPLDLGIDDDQHDYDSVASDEDTDSELTTQNNNNTQRSNRAKVSYLNTHLFWINNAHLPPSFDKMQPLTNTQLCTCE